MLFFVQLHEENPAQMPLAAFAALREEWRRKEKEKFSERMGSKPAKLAFCVVFGDGKIYKIKKSKFFQKYYCQTQTVVL